MKTGLLLTLSIIGLIFLGACSGPTSEISPTSTPTREVDPCDPVNFPALLKPIDSLLYAFDDITFVANFTPQVQLTQPIMDLQAIRRDLDAYTSPSCLQSYKSATREYMNSVIMYLSYFMGGVEKDSIDTAMQTSQQLRSVMDSEYQRLVGTSIPSSPSIQPSSFDVVQTPEIAVTGIAETIEVRNAGDQAVNIRLEPDIKSEIIGSLLAGETILGYGKDATGGWILVKTNSTYGWVNAEMVELSQQLNSIPEVSSTPTS